MTDHTQAGLAVLRRGGNAVDAALAANAVQGVVEPMSCGIGVTRRVGVALLSRLVP